MYVEIEVQSSDKPNYLSDHCAKKSDIWKNI